MPEQSFLKKFADAPFFGLFPRFAGVAVAIFGLLIIVSWYAHWRMVLQLLPNSAPIRQLQEALAQIKTLSGMIPICGWCKKVRDDKGYWESVEKYVHDYTQATFSHGMCPVCSEKFKTDIFKNAGDQAPEI